MKQFMIMCQMVRHKILPSHLRNERGLSHFPIESIALCLFLCIVVLLIASHMDKNKLEAAFDNETLCVERIARITEGGYSLLSPCTKTPYEIKLVNDRKTLICPGQEEHMAANPRFIRTGLRWRFVIDSPEAGLLLYRSAKSRALHARRFGPPARNDHNVVTNLTSIA